MAIPTASETIYAHSPEHPKMRRTSCRDNPFRLNRGKLLVCRTGGRCARNSLDAVRITAARGSVGPSNSQRVDD